jgi:extracellular elastinolytic metalloproteinase
MCRKHLLWLVITVASAHPTREISSRVDKAASLLESYRFNTVSTYTTLDQTGDVPPTADVKRGDAANMEENGIGAVPYYVRSATSQAQKIVPGASFRVVDDYYVGTNNVGHVHFQQTIDGIDVDTAYFKVNVGRRVEPQSQTDSPCHF